MAIRQLFTLLLAVVCAASIGCCAGIHGGCGGGCDIASCGLPSASCGCPDATCGCPEASCGCDDVCCDVSCGCPDDCCGTCDATCGCPDVSCGCPEASCGCDDVCCDASCGCPDDCCGNTVSCGSPVVGQCRLLQRIKNAMCGCNNGCGERYWSDWHTSPAYGCNNCTAGAQYYRQPNQYAKRSLNSARQIAQEDLGTTYR